MQSCHALRFLVKRVHFVRPYMKSLLFFQTSDRGWPACGRLGRHTSARTKTSARLKIIFLDMTYPKGWTGSLPLCPLIFSCHFVINKTQHNRSTRYASYNSICPYYKRETEGGCSFAVSAARLWNNVPLNTRKLDCIKSLKSNLFKTVFAVQQHLEHFRI